MVEMNSFHREFKGDQELISQSDVALSQVPSPPRGPSGDIGGGGTGQQAPPFRPTGGRSDFLDALWSSVNQDLLIAKTFYFFFFSAFGSLFPLMGIFFKQLGMNPLQCGVLVGFRPFVEFISTPFWGTIADRYQRGKHILLFSLVCWVGFTLALCFVSPTAVKCIYFNTTHYILADPDPDAAGYEKRSIRYHIDPELSHDHLYDDQDVWRMSNTSQEDIHDDWGKVGLESLSLKHYQRDRRAGLKHHQKLPPGHVIGQSPGPVDFTVNYNPAEHKSYVSPVFSTIVYKREGVQSAFFLIMLLVVIGEFFSSPAITLADSVTLTYLGENANNYGKQRMFGSLGWGLAMFFVGIALDHSTVFAYHPCGQPHERERNYTICFAVFSVLMGCAFITATQFRFDYDAYDDSIPMKHMQQQQQFNTGNPEDPNDGTGGAYQQPPEPKPEKSTVFASKAKEIPEWFRVLRTFANLRYGAFLFVAWYMGLGVGLVFTFLFWHLQDLGGTPTLFGVASVINHISEIFAYFFSFRLIRQIGHVRVLCLGLLGNLTRFLYVSWLTNPWWVLPFEFIQGVTHAAVWAACCSYITQATPMNLRMSAQGVLQGLHHGLGRGCGAVLGGLFATYCGTAVTFRTYGFFCLVILVAFVFINYYQPDRGFASAESVEPHQVLEETSHLAPHGVPSGNMPRALSSSRLEDMDTNGQGQGFQSYGTTEKHNGPFLDLPGGQGHHGGGGGGGGWGQIEQSEDLQDALMRAKKNSTLDSPTQAPRQYDAIRENFKAYNEILHEQAGGVHRSVKPGMDDSNGNVQLLKAPPPSTVPHVLQPVNHRTPSSYDW